MAITPNNYSFSGGAFMGGSDSPVTPEDIHTLNLSKNGESIGNYNPLVGDAIIDIPSDAFVCYYDSTAAAQIHDARRSGKAPYLYKDGIIVPLWKIETGKFTFRTTSTREVDGDTYLDIVDYVVEGLTWSTETHTVSGNGGSQQAYLKRVSSLAVFDTTGHSGMETVAYVNDVPVDGVYQVSVMLSVTPKTASPTKSDLVFGFYGTDGIGLPDHTFHAVVDDSQTFAQQLSFSTTLNLKAGTNTLKMACGELNTDYLVFVDNLTVAQLVNGVYHNGDNFDEVHTLTEAPNFNNDDGLLVDGATGGPRFMLWRTLANKVLGFIKNLTTTVTAFRTGDVIPVDGPSGTAKMSKDDLLKETAENALADNVAPAFDPTRTSDNSYKVGEFVEHLGKTYRFINEHYGVWSASDVVQMPLSHSGVPFGKKTFSFPASLTTSPYLASGVLVDVMPGTRIVLEIGTLDSSFSPYADGYKLQIKSVSYDGTEKTILGYHRDDTIRSSAELHIDDDVSYLKIYWRSSVAFDISFETAFLQDPLGSSIIGIELESGTWDDSHPKEKRANVKRIRTAHPIRVWGEFTISATQFYDFWGYCFDKNFNYINTLGGWKKQITNFDIPEGTAFINFSMRDSRDSNKDISSEVAGLNKKIFLATSSHTNDDEEINFLDYYNVQRAFTHFNDGAWKNRINIMHISDSHLTDNKVRRYKIASAVRLANYLNLPIVHTGDVVEGAYQTSEVLEQQFGYATNEIKKMRNPFIAVLGNHDANNMTTAANGKELTADQQWAWFFSVIKSNFPSVVWGDEANKKGYGYLDVTQSSKTIRFIFLDDIDHYPYAGTDTYRLHHYAVYSQEQIDWFVGVLNNIPNNYGVVVVNHFPFAPWRSSYSEEWPALNDAEFVQGWSMIPDIVKAWMDRTTITNTYLDHYTEGTITPKQDISVNADFSNRASGAKFCCYLVGHTHSKNAFVVKQEGGTNYMQLMLCEDALAVLGTALNRVWKDVNDVRDIALSSLSFDLDEGKVYRVSYGCWQKFTGNNNQVDAFPFDCSGM